jgi:hypothetical protein
MGAPEDLGSHLGVQLQRVSLLGLRDTLSPYKWTPYPRRHDLGSTSVDLRYLPRRRSRVRPPSPAPLKSEFCDRVTAHTLHPVIWILR